MEPIAVDTPAWFDWLEAHPTFTCQDAPFHFTARHEPRPGGMYWYAYKRAQGKLLKRYVGRSSELTRSRLRAVAQSFAFGVSAGASSARSSEAIASALVHQPARGQIPLLATKFLVPALPLHHIVRPRLLATLEQQTKARLTLVCAPAGSGKTTLLAAWARTTTVPVVWLSLEETEDEPLRFLSYLMAAFTHLPTWQEQESGFPPMTPGSSWEEALTPFLNVLARVLTSDIVLVLDDYHLLTAEPIHAALGFLIEHAPPHLHLLLGTRMDPPLPLARLRARGQLGELRMEALRFDAAEVGAFLRAMELDLSPEVQETLAQQTHGWIVGIQLLALALRGQDDMAPLLQSHPGTHPFFLDYVSEEVFGRLPSSVRFFLLRTSLLDRLTGPLCEAVTGLPDGQQQLVDLYQHHLLLDRLDETGVWYRYHPLFADALRTHQSRLEPELCSELYLRASRWYEAQDDREEACDYALRANDLSRAARLLAEVLPALIAQAKFTRLNQWLDRLPLAEIEASPSLFFAALGRQAAGQRSPETIEQLLTLLGERIHAQSQQPQTTVAAWEASQSQLTLLQALTALGQNDLERTTTMLKEAVRTLPEPERAFKRSLFVLLRMLLSMRYRVGGDLVAAERMVLDLSMPDQSASAFSLNLLVWWILAELYEAQGRLRTWGARTEALFQTLGPHPALPPLPLAVILMSKAALFYEWNRLPEAAAALSQVQALPEQANLGPLTALSQWMQVRLAFAQGDAEATHAYLHHEAQPERWRRYPSLAARPTRLALACGQFEVAWRWAETRHLHFDDPLEMRSNYFEYMTLARVLIARGRREPNGLFLAQALALLDRWRASAVEKGLQGNFIEIQMLTALALAAQGKTKRALRTLGPILAIAEPEGYLRLFADEGQPMGHLLAHISAYTTASPDYLRALQEAQALVSVLDTTPAHMQSLLDPLTPRELEILPLLASGYSNQQIADHLVISLNTAKRHLQHILAKLGVTNRTQAVACARDLHLL